MCISREERRAVVKRRTKKKQRTERFHRAVYASSQRLATFLMEESANHAGCYFQYTTIDALEGMYKNGCLLLTQASGLNDLDEGTRGGEASTRFLLWGGLLMG